MSLTVHEYAHARMALYFGDPTAKLAGRVTLNPLKHLDLFGTLALLLAGFGWAKPVPVNTRNMRNPRLGDIMVSFAGPASNLLLAVLAVLALRLISIFGDDHDLASMSTVLVYLAIINTSLCVLNMLPLFPLDGHHILREFLPASEQMSYMQWQVKYGITILLVLLFGPDVLSRFAGHRVFDPLSWMMNSGIDLIFKIAG